MLYPAELWVQKRRRRENPPFSGILSEASGSGGTQWHNASCIVSGSAEPPSYPFESPGFSSRQYKKRRGRDSNPRYSYPYNSLAGSPIQPLSHLSKVVNQQISTEKVGFEPTEPCGSIVFKTTSFDHSDTSPTFHLLELKYINLVTLCQGGCLSYKPNQGMNGNG